LTRGRGAAAPGPDCGLLGISEKEPSLEASASALLISTISMDVETPTGTHITSFTACPCGCTADCWEHRHKPPSRMHACAAARRRSPHLQRHPMPCRNPLLLTQAQPGRLALVGFGAASAVSRTAARRHANATWSPRPDPSLPRQGRVAAVWWRVAAMWSGAKGSGKRRQLKVWFRHCLPAAPLDFGDGGTAADDQTVRP
jgi:hypothetical protein